MWRGGKGGKEGGGGHTSNAKGRRRGRRGMISRVKIAPVMKSIFLLQEREKKEGGKGEIFREN